MGIPFAGWFAPRSRAYIEPMLQPTWRWPVVSVPPVSTWLMACSWLPIGWRNDRTMAPRSANLASSGNVPPRVTPGSDDFTSPDVEIRSYSICGGQTILVPPEVNVDVHGVGVMGAFQQKVAGQGTPGAPCVHVRGFSLWGRVNVKRKKRKHRTDTPQPDRDE